MRKAYRSMFVGLGSIALVSAATFYASKKSKYETKIEVRRDDRVMSAPSDTNKSPIARSNVAYSFEKSVQSADSTLKQLSTAKETFGDFEAFYKKFVVELNNVKEEHRHELEKFQCKITELLNHKTQLERQLLNAKEETKKNKDELLVLKKKNAEVEWENEKLSYELTTNKTNAEKLKKEKDNLQEEITLLKGKIVKSSSIETTKSGSDKKEEKDFLNLDEVKQQADELEERYRQALQEKEHLHDDIMALQRRSSELQDEYQRNMDELQAQAQNASVKAYKTEIQLQNITRQKETLMKQLEDSQDEIKKYKEKNLSLERDIIKLKDNITSYKDDNATKTRQIDTLNELNKTLEKKMEMMRNEMVSPQQDVPVEASSVPEESLSQHLLESRLQEMESMVRSSKNAKDKLEAEVLFANSAIMELKDSNQRYQDDIKDLQSKLSSTREKSSELESELFTTKNRLTNCDNNCQELKTEIKDLLRKLDAAKQRCTETETLHEQLLAERDEFKEKAMFAERKVAEMKEIIQHDEEVNNELEEKLANLKSRHFKLEVQIESNLKQMDNLKTELETEKTSKASAQLDLVALQSKLNETQRHLERKSKEYEQSLSLIEELRKSLMSKDSKIDSQNEELNKLQARLEVVEEEDGILQVESLNTEKKMKALELDNDILIQAQERLETELHNAFNNASDLQCKLNVLEQYKNELYHKVLFLEEKLNKSNSDVEETFKQNAVLEAKIQEALTSEKKKKEENEILRNQLSENQRLLDSHMQELNKKELSIVQLREKSMKQTDYAESIHDELERVKPLLESTQQDNMVLRQQLQMASDDLRRVKFESENYTKKNHELETELSEVRKKLLEAETSRRKNIELNLKKELEIERARTAEIQKKLKSCKSKMALLQSQSDSSMKDMFVATGDLECAQEKIADLSLDLEKSIEEKNDEIQKVFSLENKISDLENDLSRANGVKAKLDQELNNANMKIIKLESAMETLNTQRKTMKEKLDAANEKFMLQQEENMRLESKFNEQKKTNEALNQRISKNDHVIGELRERVRIYEANTIKLGQDLKSIQIITEGLKAEKAGLEKRCTAYQQKNQSIEADLLKARESKLLLDQELSIQKLKLSTAENQLRSISKEKGYCQQELENAQSNARKLKQELLQNHNKLHELTRRLENKAQEVKEKDTVNARLRDEKRALESEIVSLKANVADLRRAAKEEECRVMDLESTLESSLCEASLEASLFDLDREDNEWEVKAQRAEESEKQAVEREKSTKEKLKEYKSKLSAKEAELKSVLHKNAEIAAEKNDIENKYEQYKSTNDALEKEQKILKEQIAMANINISDLHVKYDFECQQRKTVEDQLSETLKKLNETRAKFLEFEQESLEKQLAIEQTGKELKDKDSDLEHSKASKRALEEQNQKLRDLLKEKTDEEEKRRSEYIVLQDELLNLRSSTLEQSAEMERRQRDLQRVHEDYQKYVKKTTILEEKIVDLSSEKEHLNRTVEFLTDSSEKHLDMSTYSERKLRDTQRHVDRLTMELSRKEENEQSLKDSIRTMQNQLEASQSATKQLEEDLMTMKKLKNNMERELKTLNDKNRIPSRAVSTPVKSTGDEEMVSKKKLAELQMKCESLQEREKELKQELSASNSEAAKLQHLYNTTNARKNELEQLLATMKKEYDPLNDDHKEALTKLEDLKLELQKMVNKNNFLEEEINKATQSNLQLEKQLNDKEHEMYVLTHRSPSPRLLLSLSSKPERFDDSPEKKKMEEEADRLRKELKDLQVKLLECSRARDEAERQMYEFKTEQNATKVHLKLQKQENTRLEAELENVRQKLSSLDKDNEKGKVDERGFEKKAADDIYIRKLLHECKYLKIENDRLKKEISHMQAQQALVKIQDSAYKNFEAKKQDLLQSENLEKKDANEEKEFSMAKLGQQYASVIAETMKLSRYLQNYKLDVLEWNANYEQITVSSERLQSAHHALQALLDDVNASYEEQKDHIEEEHFEEDREDNVDSAKHGDEVTPDAPSSRKVDPNPPYSSPFTCIKESKKSLHKQEIHHKEYHNKNESVSQQDSGFSCKDSNAKDAGKKTVVLCESFSADKDGQHVKMPDVKDNYNGDSDASEVQSLKRKIAELEAIINEMRKETDGKVTIVTKEREPLLVQNIKAHDNFAKYEDVNVIKESKSKVDLGEKTKKLHTESNHNIDKRLDERLDQNKQTKLEQIQTILDVEAESKSTSTGKDKNERSLKLLDDLQQENYELKLRLDTMKQTDGDSKALIAELRVMVARLRKELETYRKGGVTGIRRRYGTEINHPTDANNNYKPYSTWSKATSQNQQSMNKNDLEPSFSSNSVTNNEENLPTMNNKNAQSVDERSMCFEEKADIARLDLSSRNSSGEMYGENNTATLNTQNNEKQRTDTGNLSQGNVEEEDTTCESEVTQSAISSGMEDNVQKNDSKSPTTIDKMPKNDSLTQNNSPKEQSFSNAIPHATSSPTLEEKNMGNNTADSPISTDSTISKDTSIDLSGLSSPDKSPSFGSQRSTGERTSTSSTSPPGRSLYNSWPYVSVHNPYRSPYPSSYSTRASTSYTRSSFTKKYF